MLTGLYIGITIPSSDRQIAVDKASLDRATQERHKKKFKKRAGVCPPDVNPPQLSLSTNTRAGKQIIQVEGCSNDFSQTNANLHGKTTNSF